MTVASVSVTSQTRQSVLPTEKFLNYAKFPFENDKPEDKYDQKFLSAFSRGNFIQTTLYLFLTNFHLFYFSRSSLYWS
jgi:hypothetical protein